MLPWHGRGRGFKSHPVHYSCGGEFLSALSEDREQRCLEEEFLDSAVQRRGERLAELDRKKNLAFGYANLNNDDFAE